MKVTDKNTYYKVTVEYEQDKHVTVSYYPGWGIDDYMYGGGLYRQLSEETRKEILKLLKKECK